MSVNKPTTPDEFVVAMQRRLEDRDFEAAKDLARRAAEWFPDHPAAQHAAGLAWERAAVERAALGHGPAIDHYRAALGHYRRAADCEGGDPRLHLERVYACLFVLGSAERSRSLLDEAHALAERLADTPDAEERARYLREVAILRTAIARESGEPADWRLAAGLFAQAEEPDPGPEAYFYFFYRGMAERQAGQEAGDEEQLRSAARCLVRALESHATRGVQYLAADCLLQLGDPTGAEITLTRALVDGLQASSPTDPLVEGLARRWELRRREFFGEGS